MKKQIIYLSVILLFALASCKGNSATNGADTADPGQAHVGNENPSDSNKYPTTPNETGGKDTSGNGAGTTNAPKDTLKTNP